MNKKILLISCEGNNAKTEENFLKNLYKDINTLVEINQIKKPNKIKQIQDMEFNITSINFSSLKVLLDSNPAYSRIVVFIDNDVEFPWKSVKQTLEEFNGCKNNKIIFAYPSEGMSFEEFISFCFPEARKIYSLDLKDKNLKKILGEKYKGDTDIYKKVKAKNKDAIANNIKTNLNKFPNAKELRNLVFFKDLLDKTQ